MFSIVLKRFVCVSLVLVTMLVFTGTICAEQKPRVTVKLDHATGTANPAGTIQLRAGDLLKIEVENTNTSCYTFNLVEVKKKESGKSLGLDDYLDTQEFFVIHNEETSAYQIDVKKKADAKCTREGITWVIPVFTHSWTVGFSGAFTLDTLTDPVFSLEPGSEQGTDGETKAGFFIREQPDDRDSVKLGSAAMVHMYYSDPDWAGKKGISWVPVSFGIGVEEDAKTRYFVGTGVRFDSKLFLTFGPTFGSRNRLPNGLQVGGFTENSQALATLPTRTDHGWFFSLAYTFMDVDLARFKKPFAPKSPAPAAAPSEPKDTESCTISGVVTETAEGGDKGIPEVTIEWQQLDDDGEVANQGSVTTQDSGSYKIETSFLGKYTLSPKKAGYVLPEGSELTVKCESGKPASLNIKLKKS